jgi:hypothetical protein
LWRIVGEGAGRCNLLTSSFFVVMANRSASATGGSQPARTNGGGGGGGAPQNKICQFKLVLLGESAVGKSSLVLRFVKGQFHEYQESTIGGDSFTLN